MNVLLVWCEAAQFADLVEQLFRDIDAEHRRILELSMQGYSIPEIGEQLGASERTVYRRLERIKGRLQRLRGEDDAP